MDVKMSTPLLSALRTAQTGGPTAGGAVQKAGGASFSDALNQALNSVSQTQTDSTTMQNKFQMGTDGVSLEETMVGMQKAQIAFQGAVTVRNRMVSAYTDIMNMNV